MSYHHGTGEVTHQDRGGVSSHKKMFSSCFRRKPNVPEPPPLSAAKTFQKVGMSVSVYAEIPDIQGTYKIIRCDDNRVLFDIKPVVQTIVILRAESDDLPIRYITLTFIHGFLELSQIYFTYSDEDKDEVLMTPRALVICPFILNQNKTMTDQRQYVPGIIPCIHLQKRWIGEENNLGYSMRELFEFEWLTYEIHNKLMAAFVDDTDVHDIMSTWWSRANPQSERNMENVVAAIKHENGFGERDSSGNVIGLNIA